MTTPEPRKKSAQPSLFPEQEETTISPPEPTLDELTQIALRCLKELHPKAYERMLLDETLHSYCLQKALESRERAEAVLKQGEYVPTPLLRGIFLETMEDEDD